MDLPCQRHDPELWFAEQPRDVEQAKSLCQGCQARITCLELATIRQEPCGVWGGELFAAGEVIPFKRGRGRPRRSECPAEDRPGSVSA